MAAPFYVKEPSSVAPPSWRDRLLHALLPAPCLGCGQPLPATGTTLGLCQACRGRLRPITGRTCAACARPLEGNLPEGWCCASCRHHPPAFDRLLALWSYEPPLDAVVQALKFRRLDYLGRQLGEALTTRWREEIDTVDVVVPVPLHWARRLARGYNQAERIASVLAHRVDRPLIAALGRGRATPPQTSLGRDQRLVNLRKAFRIRRAGAIRKRHVLLVDDVATTGATIEAAATVLKRAGAAEITAIVAGRTLRLS
ncbi:MAG TPA: ComF family protein [Thermoanaerobaculia bacterium]|nr:ComF family protein [Thermoanaerobaculia bacterium]